MSVIGMERRPTRTSPSMARLTSVELRKTIDTRAGLVLGVITVLVVIGADALDLALGTRGDNTLVSLWTDTQAGSAFLMPLLGILLLTSEWSQRTALTTFTLVPLRGRLVGAKALAATAFAVLLGAFSLLVALAAFGIGGLLHRTSGGWSVSPWLAPVGFGSLVVVVLEGAALGLLIRNSALAITGYLLLPVVWGVVTGMTPALVPAAPWLNLAPAMAALSHLARMSGAEWGHLGSAIAVWVLLPGVLGILRLLHRDAA